MNGYMGDLNVINGDLDEWKEALPSYYEPISVPVLDESESTAFGKYPYKTRLDYVTSTSTSLLLTQLLWGIR